MALRPRQLAIAGVAGLGAAILSLVGGVWLADALDGDEAADGEFVLEEPGVFQQPADDANPDATGEPLPDVELADVDGGVVTLAAYRGEPLVVNLWYSYCPPCQRELRDFATVHRELGDRVRFVGVDPFDSVEVMLRFAAERGVTYELLRDETRELSTALEIVGYPVTLFVDPEGRIVHQTGELDADELREHLADLFGVVAG